MESPRIDPDALRLFAAKVYEHAGMPPEDARLVADSLVQADLWGHQSHGVLRLDWYRARMKSGMMAAVTRPELVMDGGALAAIEGHDGVGQILAATAMGEAIERARAHGVGVVTVRNSNHFGTAMYYTRIAAHAGCIGFLSTNASPSMAPWGGRAKVVGNNPWSIAAPAGRHGVMVLDMANTGVARGKIYLARQRGEQIPEGWAIDASGAPTVDPAAAIDGIILPMAGHKGYAIAVMMDVLSGVLSGSGFASAVHGPYQAEHRSACGHLAMAIDIARLQPMEEFTARMEALVAELKAVPLARGYDEVFFPGEIEARNDTRNRIDGLTLPADTLADLQRVSKETGIALDVVRS